MVSALWEKEDGEDGECRVNVAIWGECTMCTGGWGVQGEYGYKG